MFPNTKKTLKNAQLLMVLPKSVSGGMWRSPNCICNPVVVVLVLVLVRLRFVDCIIACQIWIRDWERIHEILSSTSCAVFGAQFKVPLTHNCTKAKRYTIRIYCSFSFGFSSFFVFFFLSGQLIASFTRLRVKISFCVLDTFTFRESCSFGLDSFFFFVLGWPLIVVACHFAVRICG